MLIPNWNRYPTIVHELAKKVLKLHKKLVQAKLTRDLICFCKSNDFIPKNFRVKPLAQGDLAFKFAIKASYIFMRLNIDNYLAIIKALLREIKYISDILNNMLSRSDYHDYCLNVANSALKRSKCIYKKHIKRLIFWGLLEDKTTKMTNKKVSLISGDDHLDRSVVNVSSRNLSQIEKAVISKGDKFAMDNKQYDINTAIVNLDRTFDMLPKELRLKKTEKARIGGLLQRKHLYNSNLTKEEMAAYRSLRMDDNIVIVKADKGGAMVVLNSKDHSDMIKYFLQSNEAFIPIVINITTYESRVNSALNKLKEENLITEEIYTKCRAKNSIMPSLNLLPKIHKDKENGYFKGRPIINTRNAPTNRLSAFIFSILSPLLPKNDTNVVDSRSFVKCLLKKRCHRLGTMISLDVKDLFTSLTVELMDKSIKCIIDEDKLVDHARIDYKGLMGLINILFNLQFFSVDNTTYKQITGAFMGSKASMVLAEIAMRKWEIDFKNRMGNAIYMYYRYVDDTFVLINKRKSNEIVNVANSITKELAFTVEKEDNERSIAFLDCEIKIVNDAFLTNVYRKDVYAGRIINWRSNIDQKHKFNTIDILVKRAYDISSNNKLLQSELIYLKKLFQLNDYPKQVISKRFRIIKMKIKHYKERKKEIDVKKPLYVSIPYSPYKLNTLQRWLGPKNIKVVSSNNNTLRFNKKKVNSDPLLKTGVVYQLGCKDCPGTYIGKTIQHLGKRIQQHKTDIGNKKRTTKLAEHSLDENHQFDFDHPNILKSCNNDHKLLKWEGLMIMRHKPLNTELPDRGILDFM